ncbi:MAG TPA: hypothetical protein VFR78_05135 [Pyrinomonadaceae bacterium]|nr:hypothetical protein [Pyrinomonadaceae bacterium]
MNRRKRRSHITHQVVISLGPLALQVAFKTGRVQIKIHIMRPVRRPPVLASRIEFTKREIGFRAKFR